MIDYQKIHKERELTTDETARALVQLIKKPVMELIEHIIEERAYLVILKALTVINDTEFTPITNPKKPWKSTFQKKKSV